MQAITIFNKLSKKIILYLKQYYFLSIFSLSLLSAGMLFYFSSLRSHETNISPVTIYCLENKDTKVCSRRHLRGKRLYNRNIKETIFTRCFCKDLHLSNVKISNSDFRSNRFNRSSFKNVSFSQVNLFKSSFYGATLENVTFENSDLGGTIFNFATLKNVHFKNIDLHSVIFIGTRFENTYYDSDTKLPFSKEYAKRIGLLPTP